MNMKKILFLLLAVAVISPVMAEKEKKGVRGKFVSITAEQLVIKVKKEEKTFTITEETKIFNVAGEEVAVADVEFTKKTKLQLKANPEDATKIIEIKEFAGKVKKGKKKKGKKKKGKKADEGAE